MKYLKIAGCAALLFIIGIMITWSRRETDLIDYIGMPQEKLVEKFGLEEIISEADRNNQIVSYREDGNTVAFWRFSQGNVVSIFMRTGTGGTVFLQPCLACSSAQPVRFRIGLSAVQRQQLHGGLQESRMTSCTASVILSFAACCFSL